MPLKRMAWAAKAASSVRARCARIAAAVPPCTAAGAALQEAEVPERFADLDAELNDCKP